VTVGCSGGVRQLRAAECGARVVELQGVRALPGGGA
jgi:hypothetical protein